MDTDTISLKVPAKPEYILVIRITTSAVASRAGFGIDEIEDIKVAVAEAGVTIMNQGNDVQFLELKFGVSDNKEILISVSASEVHEVKTSYLENEQTELSFYIMESLMDHVEKRIEDGLLSGVTLYKKFGG